MFHQIQINHFSRAAGRSLCASASYSFINLSISSYASAMLFPPSSAVRTHKKGNEPSFLRPIPQNGSRQKREPRLADSLYMSSSYSFLQKHFQIVPITGSTVAGSLLPILMSRAVLMEEVPGIQVTDDDKFRSALPETVTP